MHKIIYSSIYIRENVKIVVYIHINGDMQ